MTEICPYCDKHIATTDYDEYLLDRQKEGFSIPYENMPDDKDEVHVWRGSGKYSDNLFMHFSKEADQ